jgi:hypothetical protein
MTSIENTTRAVQRDPMLGLLTAMPGGIEAQERSGQAQLVQSTQLPAKLMGNQADFEALGFVFGDPVPGDELFREMTLPSGWSKRATDHGMHSEVIDERGLRRVSVFYKAAFYDRRADMSIVSVGHMVSTEAIYGDGDPADLHPALTKEELEDVEAGAISYIKQAGEHPDIYEDRVPRAGALLTAVRDRLGELA